MRVHLGAWDHLVLSREEFVISLFDNSGRRFGWLRPMIFPLKLRVFSRKKVWCSCVLIYYYCSCSDTSLSRTGIISGEERAYLLRERPSLVGREPRATHASFMYVWRICLLLVRVMVLELVHKWLKFILIPLRIFSLPLKMLICKLRG
jgi:hypothetical protein